MFHQLERKLVEALLRNRAFQSGVQKVHKTVHHLQHGKPPEYHQSGTSIDEQQAKNAGLQHFLKLFWEELNAGHKPGPKDKK